MRRLLSTLAQNQAVPHQPLEQGRGGGSNHAKMLPDNAGRAAGMVGDEEQCLDVDRVEFEGALDGGAGLGDLETPHEVVDPDPERVDLRLRWLRHS
jgi:hypothetical protein